MQVGRGKQGVLIGEYCAPNGMVETDFVEQEKPSHYPVVSKGGEDSNPILGYMEPAGEKPRWILWFMRNGDAILYTKRSYENGDTGAVTGKPIRIKA